MLHGEEEANGVSTDGVRRKEEGMSSAIEGGNNIFGDGRRCFLSSAMEGGRNNWSPKGAAIGI